MKNPMSPWVRSVRAFGFSAALSCISVAMAAPVYTVTNLVTDDQTAHPAQITDAGLTNALGAFLFAKQSFLGFF